MCSSGGRHLPSQGWPAQQSHALTLHVPRADRPYLGLDLSVLGSDYQPDVLIDAESVEADGLRMPEPSFYGEFFLKKGQRTMRVVS